MTVKYSIKELAKMGFKTSIAGYFDINGLKQDQKEIQSIVKAFQKTDKGYYYENFILYDKTEYRIFYDNDECSVSCSVSINNVSVTIASTRHSNVSNAVYTTFMNASGFIGDFSEAKIQKIIDSMEYHNNNATDGWEEAEKYDYF